MKPKLRGSIGLETHQSWSLLLREGSRTLLQGLLQNLSTIDLLEDQTYPGGARDQAVRRQGGQAARVLAGGADSGHHLHGLPITWCTHHELLIIHPALNQKLESGILSIHIITVHWKALVRNMATVLQSTTSSARFSLKL